MRCNQILFEVWLHGHRRKSLKRLKCPETHYRSEVSVSIPIHLPDSEKQMKNYKSERRPGQSIF